MTEASGVTAASTPSYIPGTIRLLLGVARLLFSVFAALMRNAALLAVCLTLFLCDCVDQHHLPVGAECRHDNECAKTPAGEHTDCYRERCMSQSQADVLREQDMLRQSGVVAEAESTAAEAPIPVPAPAWVPERPVRQRTATGDGFSFAVCSPTEQLVGGGCSLASQLAASYPSAKNKQHTLGGRWTCVNGSNSPVTAHVLCVEARPQNNPAAR